MSSRKCITANGEKFFIPKEKSLIQPDSLNNIIEETLKIILVNNPNSRILPGQTSDCGSIRYAFCIEVRKAAKNHTRIHVITTEFEEPRETPAFALVAQGPQNRLEYALK